MIERFDAFEAKVDTKTDASQVDHLKSSADAIASDVGTIKVEMTAQNHQLGVPKDWIERASTQLKVKYERTA